MQIQLNIFCRLQKVKVGISDFENGEKDMRNAKYGSGLNLAQRSHITIGDVHDGFPFA